MALDETERAAAWTEFMRNESESHATIGVTKADLRAAFNAADDWVDANSTSYNSALPQPARGALTARQKALLLAIVLRRRYGVTA